MIQIAYISSTRGLLSAEQLMGLLVESRARNAAAGITGMLLYKDGNVLQIIEGESAAVTELFERIRHDARHRGVIKLYEKTVAARDFPEWMMGFRELDARAAREVAGFCDILDPGFDMMKLSPSSAATLLSSFKSSMR